MSLSLDYPAEYYRRKILIPQKSGTLKSLLTYALDPKPSTKRSLLLAPFHPDFLSNALRTNWNELVKFSEDQIAGNFYLDKYLVSLIRSKPDRFPKLGVAVHHFGPVPVLYTGISYQVELHGETTEAEVVLYHNRINKNGDQYRGMFPADQYLLESLTGTFGIVMQRYFEDVAQIFRAICRQASLPEAFEWAKLAEDFIGKSIQSKLRKVIPHHNEWSSWKSNKHNGFDQAQKVRCHLYEQSETDIYLAQYFRLTTLYFLNELYKHLGLESRSKDYLDKIEESYKNYDKLNGAGAAKELVDNYGDIELLRHARKYYHNNELDKLKNLRPESVWMECIVEFAIFLLNLNHNKIPSIKGRIFISYNHGVSASEHLKKQFEHYFAEHYTNEIEILTVENLHPDANIYETIQTLIWQADRTIIIVPKDPTKPGAIAGNYQWLAREAEHAFLLSQKINYFLEDGYNEEQFLSAMTDEKMEFLAPDAITRDQNRTAALLQDFKNRPRIKFTLRHQKPAPHWEDLGKNLQDALSHAAEHAIEARHHNMIKGFLQQFPEDTLIVLYCLAKIGGSRTKVEFVGELFRRFGNEKDLPFTSKQRCTRAFENAWSNTKARHIGIINRRLTVMLIQRDGQRHVYSLNIKWILRALQPSISKEKLEQWMARLFNEVLPERAKGI
ncbi:hypothetical protein QQ020_35115 [Fulvivirgaceae bacterium BMA12]|uniref:SIR2-like domain-containing protein n=1 Tax=Agaribacillus aureus TaxID=3051825 RepID=A0ABT8LIK8_9BACT|nr:hypothetical protein [Fulvivirgaceae bacterium BMA12]